jgi:hypothetical protein
LLIFINKVMSKVYTLIFNTNLPRVLDDRGSIYNQIKKKGLGTRYCSCIQQWSGFMVFMNPPIFYLFFPMPKVFSLEFIRQIIISKTKHFLKFHKASNLKFPFIIGPFIVKTRSCLSHIQSNIKEFGFSQLQGRIYDPNQIISKRILMKKHAPYEHEHVDGFDKLANLEFCADMETILQPTQT